MGGYLASRLLKHCSRTFDRVTDSLIFNMDCVSNGLGRTWFPVTSYTWKSLACCAHQRLLFQHMHKFLLCRDVRPRKRSLFHCPPLPRVARVYQYHQQCPGQIWFLQITTWVLKHFRFGEPPVLDINTLEELPGFKEEPVVIWLILIVFVNHGLYIEKVGIWYFWELWWWTFKFAMIPSRGLCSL